MPNKTVSFMMNEKDIIIKRITTPLQYTDLTQEVKPGDLKDRKKTNVYKRAVRPFVGAKEFAAKSEENENALLDFSNQLSKVWGEMLHKVESLYLYKAACIEHQKMAASDKIPESYKKISKNCILEIEQALKKNGFTDEMLKQALTDAHFENKFLPDYAEKVGVMYAKFSVEHDLPLDEELTPEVVTDALMYHTNKVEKGTVRLVTDIKNVIADPIAPNVSFGESGLSYFNVDYKFNTVATQPRKYDEDHYKYFVLKDGKFVDRPAPSGFFSKIAFYFNKYIWDVDAWDNEKKQVEVHFNKEQEELAKVPEDIDEKLVADLTSEIVIEKQTDLTTKPAENSQETLLENAQFTEQLGQLTNDEIPAHTEEIKVDPTQEAANMSLGGKK